MVRFRSDFSQKSQIFGSKSDFHDASTAISDVVKIKFAKFLALHTYKYDSHMKYLLYTFIIHHVFEVLKKTPEKVDNLLRSNYLRVRFFLDFGQIFGESWSDSQSDFGKFWSDLQIIYTELLYWNGWGS